MAKSAISKSVTPSESSEVLGKPRGGMSSELEKMMNEESKIVRGKFKNYETPGGTLPFCGGKYPGQPIFKMTFADNEVYDVPLWVARWLNGIDATAKGLNGKIGSCSYAVHGFKWDAGKPAPASVEGPGGVPISNTDIQKRVQRYGFESLEFDGIG